MPPRVAAWWRAARRRPGHGWRGAGISRAARRLLYRVPAAAALAGRQALEPAVLRRQPSARLRSFLHGGSAERGWLRGDLGEQRGGKPHLSPGNVSAVTAGRSWL